MGLAEVEKPEVEVEALTVLGLVAPASHVNVLPLKIVATRTSPKLSKDQLPGSKVTLLVPLSVPHVESPHR